MFRPCARRANLRQRLNDDDDDDTQLVMIRGSRSVYERKVRAVSCTIASKSLVISSDTNNASRGEQFVGV